MPACSPDHLLLYGYGRLLNRRVEESIGQGLRNVSSEPKPGAARTQSDMPAPDSMTIDVAAYFHSAPGYAIFRLQ